MVFSSITFLFLFLPLTLIVYYICPGALKNIWLLLASLVFYAFGEPLYILLLLGSICINYASGVLIEHMRQKSSAAGMKLVLIISLILNLGALAVFKYLDLGIALVSSIAQLFGQTGFMAVGLALPIGISFFTFQGLSYVIDVYRGKVGVQRNPLYFGMYIALFPQLIAGPIVRYSDVETEINHRTITADMLGDGMERFILGLCKKILIANICGEMVASIQANSSTVCLAWLSAIAYMLQIYFDFSGYSDMAIGIGLMMGFHFPENFLHPYEATSITEFWNRWHVTLSSFFKEYVYIPLGGNRKGVARQVFNLFIVWALTGLWHGAGANFIAWGIYYFIFLVLEKFVFKRFCANWPRILKHLYTLFVVLIGWVLFSNTTWDGLVAQLSAMFGIGASFFNGASAFYGMEYALLLVVFAFFATSYPKKWYQKLPSPIRLVLGLLGFGLSVALLINGSYNPFLYFRF